MIGLGTLIDVTLILLGGFAGLAFGRFISGRIQDTLLKATAVAIIFIGISGAMSGMLTVSGGEISAGGSALVVMTKLTAMETELVKLASAVSLWQRSV